MAPLTRFAAGASVTALLVAGYAALRPLPAPPNARAAACSCDDLQREVEALRLRVGAQPAPDGRSVGAVAVRNLTERVAALEAEAERRGDPGAAPAPSPNGAAPVEGPRRFVRFEPPSRAVEVKQLPDGSLAVTNTDPSLSGQRLVVRAHAEDGSVAQVSIIVPEPAR